MGIMFMNSGTKRHGSLDLRSALLDPVTWDKLSGLFKTRFLPCKPRIRLL